MPSELDRLFTEYASPILAEKCGEDVTYRRAGMSVTTTGQVAIHDVGADVRRGIRESWRGIAVVFSADDLEIDGETIVPAGGDEVVIGVTVYAVARPPQSAGVFEWLDVAGTELVVYAKESRTEA